MTIGEIPETYQQEPRWRPDTIDAELQDLAASYLESDEVNMSVENEIAKKLAEASLGLFGGENADIYQTDRAINKGEGNCFARTGGSIGLGLELDLDMELLWSGIHASALWVARSKIWRIDGDHSLWGIRPWGRISNKSPKQHTNLGHKIMAKAGGRAVIDPDATTLSTVRWRAIEGELGDNHLPYKRNLLVLQGEEGIKFLTAIGDRIYYARSKPPEYLQALGSQIDRYIIRPKPTS